MDDAEPMKIIIRRLDQQDELLHSLKINIDAHVAREESLNPALEEMASMWSRSKVVASFFTWLASSIAILAGGYTWLKDHLK